jgi:electron transfer flavoprotein alpha/beta subunit
MITSKDVDATTSELGLEGSYTKVVKIFKPEPPAGGEVVTGSPEELAERILAKLLECRVI